ncbi:hypothetical protein HDU67_008135 [Dinochytrium kinnereticum]|nr:hypothetical protein HDU67_008135 [Dinochytrium kinnereticum]
MLDQLPVEIVVEIAVHLHPYNIPELTHLCKNTLSRFTFIHDISFAHRNIMTLFARRPPTNADFFSVKWHRLTINYWAVLILLRGLTERTLKMVSPHHFISFSLSSPTTFPALPPADDPVTKAINLAWEYGGKSKVDLTVDRCFPLIYGCITGNIFIVERFFSNGGGTSLVGGTLQRVFCAATTYGHSSVVKYLLEKYPNLDCSNLLVLAATVGQIGVFRMMLERVGGAKSIAPNFDEDENDDGNDDDGVDGVDIGSLALRFASTNGHIEIVKILLDLGCDPRLVSENRAIIGASRNGHSQILNLLLTSGGDPRAGRNGAFINACENGHDQCVKILLAYPTVDPSASGNRPIKAAACLGHEGVVRMLLECGERVDPNAERGFALRMARANGHVRIVEMLLADRRVRGLDRREELASAVCAKVMGRGVEVTDSAKDVDH